ncbi:MAG TPA: 4-hydroxythreonine-4-phosphate dehydrogenase PdxA [Chitinophagaceae bacterium]|nr:4-hydroxythreonine-4-phosphate dehydrogenase PdxA [Chitinophagaceae bacterium]
MPDNKPIVGITMGDPAGIGPEIAIKVLQRKDIYKKCHPVIVGDAQLIQSCMNTLDIKGTVHAINHISEAYFEEGTVDVYDLKNVDVKNLKPGEISAMAGDAAFEAVTKTIQLALDGEIDASVTGPIHKKSMNEAGHHYAGHTEIYAEYTNTKEYAMLLAEKNFRVIHVSTHVSLREACDLVKKERILEVIRLLDSGLRQLGIDHGKIGIAGLNPHAGDSGLFGDEDEKEIVPAVKEALNAGYNVEGPVPPDTLFAKAATGYYDGCVAMYHDQGHIPFKMAGFKWDNEAKKMESVKGVNITLGLPIIRVSVDHGTAFDIAWKGVASPDAMVLAINYATQFALNKKSAS